MLALIGGSGLYSLEGLEIEEHLVLDTAFGNPSTAISRGVYQGQSILFLPRHGIAHQFLPHEVNYRANIFALKTLGATQIVSISAAGSLREDIRPGDLALVSQYFDHTRGQRQHTFFGQGVSAHIATANPCCPALSADIIDAAKRINLPLHQDKTYGCIEGPRLGTRAESHFLRSAANCDLVGMTNVPEAFLAREAQMAYCSVCLITDYDCWKDDSRQHVSMDQFFATYGGALTKAQALFAEFIRSPLRDTPNAIRHSLENAMLTPPQNMNTEQQQWFEILCQ
ncbi:MTAP family purine nucleoside phosphorylase [Porticoccaceae bacterium]|nr:MTAP family purine nucleoside phosphorylase [Porticoccaceae bacterium]